MTWSGGGGGSAMTGQRQEGMKINTKKEGRGGRRRKLNFAFYLWILLTYLPTNNYLRI